MSIEAMLMAAGSKDVNFEENFEDFDSSLWDEWGANASLYTPAIQGDYCAEIVSSGSTTRAIEEPIKPVYVSLYIRASNIGTHYLDYVGADFRMSTGFTLFRISLEGYSFGDNWFSINRSDLFTWAENTWYFVELKDIDFDLFTAQVFIDGNFIQEVGFHNDYNEPVGQVRLSANEHESPITGYFDALYMEQ